MIAMLIASAILAAAWQTAQADAARKAFTQCLREAVDKAASQKVPATGFEAFVRTNCDASASSLKSAMIAFDVKNKVSRKQAMSDAQLQVDDYYVGALDRYKSRVETVASQ